MGDLPVSAFLRGDDPLPPGYTARHVTPEAFEVYGDELDKINKVFKLIKGMFEYTPMNDDSGRERFEEVVKNEFGEIGFHVEVDWYLVRLPNGPGPDGQETFRDVSVQGRPLFEPKVVFMGRTDPETEIDHARIQHNVRAGLYDGVKGVIDPNTGQLREESKKTQIFLGKDPHAQ